MTKRTSESPTMATIRMVMDLWVLKGVWWS